MIDGVTAGTTSYIMTVMAYDSSSTVGAGKTGITYNGGITCYYKRSNGSADVSCTINTITTLGTYAGSATNAAWKEVDSTNMPGVYELHIPNNAFASGATDVMIYLLLSGVVPIVLYFRINPPADIQTALGTAITCTTGGIPDVNMKNIVNAAVSASSAQIGVNVVNIAGQAAAIDAQNLLKVDVEDWKGTALPAQATSGIPDVNVKNMNNVAATSITTINANQGSTQPLNFTGTGASALAKVDVTDIATAAVATGTAQLGVNVVNMGGSALSTSSAQVGVNVVSQNNIDFGALQKASLNAATPASVTGSVGSVTGNVGGNVTGSVGSIAAGAINNAAFNGDVASTAYASNTLAQMLYKFFDNAFASYGTWAGYAFTPGGFLDRFTKLAWLLRNQVTINDTSGNLSVYDDGGNLWTTVNGALTDSSGTTERLFIH